jgi:hypothetical protein
MALRGLRGALLAASGLALIATGSAIAQQEQKCGQRLDRIEHQLSRAKLEPQRQSDIAEVIEGARLLAKTGDQDGCMNVVAKLDQLMTTLDEAGRPGSTQGGDGGADAGSQQPQARERTPAPPRAARAPQPEQAQDQQAQRPATRASPLAAMPASDVIGAQVLNRVGDAVAEIVDLVTRPGQEDLFAVLSVGGFLGIGDKEVVVPVDELEVGQDDQIVIANASEDQLKQMPPYEEKGYERAARTEQAPAQQH